MVYKLADNILSPLGMTTQQNFEAISQGKSRLRRYESKWGLKEPFVASLFSDEQRAELAKDGLTLVESVAIESITAAATEAHIELSDKNTILILSTTKGNVDLLRDSAGFDAEREYPGLTAKVIADHLGMLNKPIVVCNACISGVSAIVLAKRLIEDGYYDNAVVCGIDLQNKFIISGFQSFKALSPTECKPFDAKREGLNLGEACATIILSKHPGCNNCQQWIIERGSMYNDANHISAPSRTAEGSMRALMHAKDGIDNGDIAFINLHGTATSYNDQMESIAIERSGLSDVPVNGLKGYYGHTMGAAGVLETLLSMKAVEAGIALGVRGFNEIGVPGKVNISSKNRTVEGKSFIKLLSGFGGCNGALRARLIAETDVVSAVTDCTTEKTTVDYKVIHSVRITPDEAFIDERRIETTKTGKALVTELYRMFVKDYPKYFKMDLLTKLAFVGSEMLLDTAGGVRFEPQERTGVVLFNRVSSLYDDRLHQETIADDDNSFASPSIFVYTLPNITTGEIALRNKLYGETAFYVLPEKDENQMDMVIKSTLGAGTVDTLITGWVDCIDDNDFEASLQLINRE